MLYSKSIWKSQAADPVLTQELARSLSVSPLVSSLLAARGMHTPEEARRFLYGDGEAAHDPYMLHGMELAVPRIRRALAEGEHILVYGDYDADGVSSTALMIYLLRHLNASFDIYIPHRSLEGYGLHNHALDWAAQQGVSLIITVDTGISAVSQIAYAETLGIEVIVTDHHEPPEILPAAYALINPKLKECQYPFKGLAGVGVAFKLAEALLDGEVPEAWTEIAAIGTVADLMPLRGENRELVRRGLASMRRSAFPGVKALLNAGAVKMETVSAVNIAFAVAPRINASGRMDHAGRAVTLLTTASASEAEALAEELDLLNRERQMLVERIVLEAEAQLELKRAGGGLPGVIVLAAENWNVGVVGIVASKLLERHYRPVIILDIHPETGMCKGSARSIPGLDIYSALCSCSGLMDHFGGHPAAAGMSLHRERLPEFEAALQQYADGVLTPELLVPVTAADAECGLADLTLDAATELELLAPFGMSNPQPRFAVRGAVVQEVRTMGQGARHLKLTLRQGKASLDTVAFGKGHLAELLPPGTAIDVLAELSVNEWNGVRRPQLMLHDLAVQDAQLFDMRGAADALGAMRRLTEALVPYSGPGPLRAAVVCRRVPPLEQLPPEWRELPVWRYDEAAGLVPEQGAPVNSGDAGRLSLLCLLDLPRTPEELEAVTRIFAQAENVALLNPRSTAGDRLQIPTRDLFKTLYRWLAALAASPVQEQEALRRLARQSGLTGRMLKHMLDVFEELDFIKRENGLLAFVPQPQARSLDSSRRFVMLGRLAEAERHFQESGQQELQEWIRAHMAGAS